MQSSSFRFSVVRCLVTLPPSHFPCSCYLHLVPTISAMMIKVSSLIALCYFVVAADSFQLQQQSNCSNRREMVQKIVASTASIFLPSSAALADPSAQAAQNIPTNKAPTSAGRRGCKTDTNPSRTVVTCTEETRKYNADGRLSTVSATANGVSTSAVRNPSRFSPPWSFLTETSDSKVAWNSLVKAVSAVDGDVEIVELTDECE